MIYKIKSNSRSKKKYNYKIREKCKMKKMSKNKKTIENNKWKDWKLKNNKNDSLEKKKMFRIKLNLKNKSRSNLITSTIIMQIKKKNQSNIKLDFNN